MHVMDDRTRDSTVSTSGVNLYLPYFIKIKNIFMFKKQRLKNSENLYCKKNKDKENLYMKKVKIRKIFIFKKQT